MTASPNPPKYRQIAEAIASQIRSGQLPAHVGLSSERELCETWQTSPITVRRSLLELVKEGLIIKRHGVGSFVAPTPAKKPSSKTDRLLGVVIPSAADYHNGRVLAALERASRRHGYSLVVKQSGNTPKGESESIRLLVERNVSGILISPVTGDSSETLVSCANLLASKVPFVLFDRYLPMLTTPYVIVDNVQGGYAVTRHMIDIGHKRITYLRGVASSSADDREKGYRKALEEAGLPANIYIVGDVNYDMDVARARVAQFLTRERSKASAVFAENDGFARAVYDVCRQRGLSIPGDLAVAGFDDAPYASLLMPSLTTVLQSDVDIAHRAMELLSHLINGVDSGTTQIVLAPELRARESTQGATRSPATHLADTPSLRSKRRRVSMTAYPGGATKEGRQLAPNTSKEKVSI